MLSWSGLQDLIQRIPIICNRVALPFLESAIFVLVRDSTSLQLTRRKLSAKVAHEFLPMITYEKVLKKPQIVESLIGMSLVEFEKFYTEFELVHRARLRTLEHTQRNQLRRRRAAGAGPKHKYSLCNRLLMTLFWLRAYTTYKVLGLLYDLDKTTVEENLKNVMHTLSLMSSFRMEHPQPEIPKLRSVQEVINAFPDVLLVMDPEDDPVG